MRGAPPAPAVTARARPLAIALPSGGGVWALLESPPSPLACYVFAHGAGAGMHHRRLPGVPLFAGGKSFGGRMSSQAQAAAPLADVRGLVFVGFPLHAAGKPSAERARHLADVAVPMLFLQGTRDTLADLSLVQATTAALGRRVTLHVVDGADHSFHVLVRSGRDDAQVLTELAETTVRWIAGHCG